MIDRIRLRRDTSDDWSLYNPVLASGEPGIELDTNRLKVGNGILEWNELPYMLGNLSGLELGIGNGFQKTISWDVVDNLNFVGSGDTNILFDDGSNTITIYSSGTLPVLTSGDIINGLGYIPQITGNYAAGIHNHLLSDISGLQAALDSKQGTGLYANLVHYHQLSDVSGLIGVLNNKQPLGSYSTTDHTHTLYISNGISTVISYNINDPLKFIASGNVFLGFNDINNSIIIGSSGGTGGESFGSVDIDQILFKNSDQNIVGSEGLRYEEIDQVLKVNNFLASGDITGIIDGGIVI